MLIQVTYTDKKYTGETNQRSKLIITNFDKSICIVCIIIQ